MHPRSNSVADSHKNLTADYPTQRNANKQKGHIQQTQHQLIQRDGVRSIKLKDREQREKEEEMKQNRNNAREVDTRNHQKQKSIIMNHTFSHSTFRRHSNG